MKYTSSLVAAAAALLLNAALIFAALTGLSSKVKPDKPAPPVIVRLLSPPVPTPPVPIPASEAKTPEARPEQKHIKKRPTQKPQVAPRKAHQARTVQDAQAANPTEQPQATPDPFATSTPAQASMATSGTSSTATPPTPEATKTEVSVASYAATNPTPPYPRLSRLNEEQGTVVLRVLVKPDGTAGTVEIKNSSGFELLDEAAKNTVQTWRFNPATINGKPVAEWYQVPIPFKLRDK